MKERILLCYCINSWFVCLAHCCSSGPTACERTQQTGNRYTQSIRDDHRQGLRNESEAKDSSGLKTR